MAANRIVGRETELDVVVALLDRARERGASLVVDGEAGIGKSALLGHVCDVGEAAGWRVLRCRGMEHERHLAYAGLDELLATIDPAELTALPDPQRAALEVALVRRASAAPIGEREVGLAVTTLVASAADAAPMLIVVDDAHWLDSATTRVIAFAARRLVGRPIAIVVGRRSGGQARAALDRALEPGALDRLTLGPMDRDDIDELLRSRLGLRMPLPQLTALHEATRGNPLLALEMARQLDEVGGDLRHGRLPVPEALQRTLRLRIRRLSPEARRALEVVSIGGRPRRELVASVLGAAGERGTDELVVSGSVTLSRGRLDAFHPLLRSVVLDGIGPARLRRLHQALAGAVTSEDERAWHLARATSEPDREVARGLAAAASRAEDRGAAMTAFELAADALALTPEDDRVALAERTIVAARLAFHAGDPRWAAERLRRVLTDPDLPRRGELLHLLSRIELQTDGIRPAMARLREAEPVARSDYLRGRIAIDLANHSRSTEGIDVALAHARRALAFGRRARHDGLLGEIHAILAALEFRAGRGIRRRRLAVAAAYVRREGRAGVRISDEALAYQLLWAGHVREARDLIKRLAATSDPDVPLDRVTPTWQLAVVEWRAGRWDESSSLLELSQRASNVAGRHAVSPAAQWLRAVLAAHRGALGSARSIIKELLPAVVTAGDEGIANMARWVAGFVELSAGLPVEALERLEPLAERALNADPGAAFELPDLVEALVAVGRLDDAEAVLEAFEARSRKLGRRWGLANAARGRALVEAARGRLADGAAAIGPWSVTGCMEEPFCIARNQLVLGMIERRRKRRAAAAHALVAARDGFQRLGAVIWADRAAGELARTGGSASGLVELTPTEGRIAVLAGEGRTNREIADLLFLSPKTVEWNLTRVYQKLGVRSRTELARRSREVATPDQAAPTLPG